MQEVTIVIPNYNGIKYIESCLNSLKHQTCPQFRIIVVDNASTDGSREVVQQNFPDVTLIQLNQNYGFCRAVNEGIKSSVTPYVLLLNNDTEVDESFVEQMLAGMKKNKKTFSCGAKMVQYHNQKLMDDAGDFYCAFGWAFARGKGKPKEKYDKETKVFASCAGAAIYKREIFDEIGYFDEAHFAYLEDIDVGYRAQIAGYENRFLPKAVVYHVGSGTSGSAYNPFKMKYSSRNSIYLIYKNMPVLQIILNMPFFIFGFFVKWLFFVKKKMGKSYLSGLMEGFSMCKKEKKVEFKWKNMQHYCYIQLQLWLNMIKRVIY